MKLEDKAKKYVKSRLIEDVDVAFLLYDAFISGYNFALPYKKMANQPKLYDKIIEIVCDYYNILYAELQSKKRNREFVTARQMCVYFGRKYTHLTFARLSKPLNRKHSNALIGLRVISGLAKTDKDIITDMAVLELSIKKLFLN